jgi:hypothetical protein
MSPHEQNYLSNEVLSPRLRFRRGQASVSVSHEKAPRGAIGGWGWGQIPARQRLPLNLRKGRLCEGGDLLRRRRPFTTSVIVLTKSVRDNIETAKNEADRDRNAYRIRLQAVFLARIYNWRKSQSDLPTRPRRSAACLRRRVRNVAA